MEDKKKTKDRLPEYIVKPIALPFDEQNLKTANRYQKTLRGESPRYALYLKDTGYFCDYRDTSM